MEIRKAFAATVLLCSQAATAHAAMGGMETGPGCGLGAQMWADSASRKHIVQQSFIATTNGIGSQTLAISSGTSGCTNDGVIVQDQRVPMYAGFNYDALVQDMARGQGEHLASLATLMGVPAEQQPAFFAFTQDRYDALVQGGRGNSVTLVAAVSAQWGAQAASAPH